MYNGPSLQLPALPPPPPLYAVLLGTAWATLSPAVRLLHDGTGPGATGKLRVRRGASWLARALASLMGMPAEGDEVPVTLRIATGASGDRWIRAFAGRPLETLQRRDGACLVEELGLFQCRFFLRADGGALIFDQVGAALGFRRAAIPLPTAIAPRIVGSARSEQESVRVDVQIYAPIVGLLVAYDGLVAPREREQTA